MSWGISHTQMQERTHTHTCAHTCMHLLKCISGDRALMKHKQTIGCTQTCHTVYHGVKHVSSHTADNDKIPHPLQSVISNSSLCCQWPVVSHTHHQATHIPPPPHTTALYMHFHPTHTPPPPHTTTTQTHHPTPCTHLLKCVAGDKAIRKCRQNDAHTRLSFCLPRFS